MKKCKFYILTFYLLLTCLFLLTGCGQSTNPRLPATFHSTAPYPLTISNYDEKENPVSYTYQRTPQRVVITHPGATELLLELGLQDSILSTVAPYGAPLQRLVSHYAKLPIMQAAYTPSQEELLEVEPDLIISWAHQFSPQAIGDVQTWHQRGIGTFIMPSTLTKTKPTLETTVYACIADLGKIFNIQDKASAYIQHSKDRVATIQKSVMSIQDKKTVLVLQDHFNGTFSLYDTSYLISHMIDIAGGQNICQTPTAFVGAEKVLAFDPDFIIVVTSNLADGSKDVTDEEAIQNLRGVKELQSMRAIRTGNIINLPFFTVNNGGVRTIDGIEKITNSLYPGQLNSST